MGLIACQECGAQISDKAAACPKCGAPMTVVPVPDVPVAEESSIHWTILKVMLIGITAVVVYQCATFSDKQARIKAKGAPVVSEFSSMDALQLCQFALKKVARDPETAKVPYVPDHGRGDESYFAWGAQTKMARMRNGLGLEVAASASCVVDRKSKRITSLTLNGQSII